jgi:outer membrane lipoprotein-sorting protein
MPRFAAAVLLAAASLAAQSPQAMMEARARAIRSLSATVEQRIAVLGMDQTMEGRVRFMAPELLRMDLAMTVGGMRLSTVTVSNGKTLVVYTDMLRAAQSFDLARVRSVRPGWTGDAVAPDRPFQDLEPGSIRELGEETVDGIPCLKFEGRPSGNPSTAQALPDLALARLWLGKEDGFPRRVVFLDRRGKELFSQRFTGVTLNPLLDPALFMFRPPEGVKVVDSTDLILQTLGGAPEE